MLLDQLGVGPLLRRRHLLQILGRLVVIDRRRHQRQLGQILRRLDGLLVVAVVLVPLGALGVVARQHLALLERVAEVALALERHDDAILQLRVVRVVGPLRERALVDLDGVEVLGLVEVDVAELGEDLAHVRLVLAAAIELLGALEPGLGVVDRVAVPVLLGEADAEVLHRLGAQIGALGARLRLLLVGEDDQLVEALDRLRIIVGAVVRPGQLVERLVEVGRVLEVEHARVGGDRQLELAVVEVVLADARPRLGQEARVVLDRLALGVRVLDLAPAHLPLDGCGGAGGSSGLYLLLQTSARIACSDSPSLFISPRHQPSR